MGIDWFTFGAQIFNFLLLVFLLQRFLYKPIVGAIERREARIREHLEEARRTEEQAEAERVALEASRVELEEQRAELIQAAEIEADERRRELSEQIREESAAIRKEWHESLKRSRESFLEELRRRVSEEFYVVVRRVLEDLADEELEDRVVHVFLRRLESLTEEQRTVFAGAVDESHGRARVRSAFSLADDHRKRIEEVVGSWTGGDVELQFEEDAALALGVELGAGDRKIGWSVESYLEALEADVGAFIDAEVE